MNRLTYLQTVRPVRNPHWSPTLPPEQRFDTGRDAVIDRFDAANGYDLEDLGVKVRITGEYRAVLVPWMAISYAEEDTSTPIETTDTVAATPRAKRGASKS